MLLPVGISPDGRASTEEVAIALPFTLMLPRKITFNGLPLTFAKPSTTKYLLHLYRLKPNFAVLHYPSITASTSSKERSHV